MWHCLDELSNPSQYLLFLASANACLASSFSFSILSMFQKKKRCDRLSLTASHSRECCQSAPGAGGGTAPNLCEFKKHDEILHVNVKLLLLSKSYYEKYVNLNGKARTKRVIFSNLKMAAG